MGEENKAGIFILDVETGQSLSIREVADILPEWKTSTEVIGWTCGVNADDNGVTISFKVNPRATRALRKVFGINNNWRKRHGLPMYRAINKRRRHA